MNETNGHEYLYGADSKEWLDRWDAGQTVWTIEMGGLGPGYEQAIHITVAEILRIMNNSDLPEKLGRSQELSDEVEKQLFENQLVKGLGISGAQFSVAMGLAFAFFFDGPVVVMEQPEIKDRHILVSKNFPTGEKQ